MSVFRKSGLVFKPSGVVHHIVQQLKQLDLKPVKKVSYKFDPFHPNSKEFRDLIFHLSSPRIRETNLSCTFKTEVVSDLSQPELKCHLDNGKILHFKAGNLTTLEILQVFNKVVLPLVPPPDTTAASAPKTKSSRRK